MPSARQVTGVGPRHAFTFTGTGSSGITTDQVIGTGIIVSSEAGSGKWHVTHNLGKTGYCVSASAQSAYGTEMWVNVNNRHGNTFGIECQDSGGNSVNPDFVHCIIYD